MTDDLDRLKTALKAAPAPDAAARDAALHLAQQQGLDWPRRVHALAFLGTPHHGAPLERGGLLVDRLLGISPYVAPFARLGRSRSAGITDLRFGNLQDADWQGRDTQDQRHDDRVSTPLPAGVKTCLVAATTAEQVDSLRTTTPGCASTAKR